MAITTLISLISFQHKDEFSSLSVFICRIDAIISNNHYHHRNNRLIKRKSIIYHYIFVLYNHYSTARVRKLLYPISFSSSTSSVPLLTLTFSLFTSSVTVRVSITGFFLITTSSLTYGCFEISISSFFNGILISLFD